MSDRDLPRGVRRLMRAAPRRSDIDDELTDHFRRVEEELIRSGMSQDDAEREARRRFGDVRRWRRRIASIDEAAGRRQRASTVFGAVASALANALRGVRTWPGLSLAVVFAFALGIGANATVYGILDRLLLSPPLHVSKPDGVVRFLVERSFLGRRSAGGSMAFPDAQDFEASSQFSQVAAYSGNRTLTVGRGRDAERIRGRLVVIGHGYWQRSFGGSSEVIGKSVDFGHGPYTIIGVAPRGFAGIDLAPVDVWLPMQRGGVDVLGGEFWIANRGMYFLNAVARLAPGASSGSATADATRLHRIGRQESIAN